MTGMKFTGQLLLFQLLYSLTSTAKVTITCDAPRVTAGQPATVTCDFKRNVSALSSATVTVEHYPDGSANPTQALTNNPALSRSTVTVEHYPDGSANPTPVLECTPVGVDCKLPVPGYTFNNQINTKLVLKITRASMENRGRFACKMLSPDLAEADEVDPCDFIVDETITTPNTPTTNGIFTVTVPTEPPQTSTCVSAFIGVVGFLVIVIVVLVFLVVYFRNKGQRKGAVSRTPNPDIQGERPRERVSGHSYEEVPDAVPPRPPRCHHHGQVQTSRHGRSPAASTRPAVDSQPEDYLNPVNSQTASSGTNQSADAPAAAPGGPYDSLEMSDVGLRSPYSQLGM